MNHLTLCLLLVLPAACARTPASSAQPTTRPWADLAIMHVNVIDVTDGSVRPDQTVLISGDRIVALGPSHDVRLPGGAEMIDARGGYLIPGLWDMHAHAASEGRAESFFRLLLANGVTGFRDPFGSREVADRASAAVAADELPGPARIIVAGNLVDGPPGSVPGARIAAVPEDGRRLVDSLHAAGVPFIKVYFQLAPETYFAIAERSRELGVPFVGHVPMFVRVADASDAGQGSIEHLTGVLTGCSTDEEAVLVDWHRLMGLLTTGDVASFTRQVMEPVRRVLATQDEARCRRLAERFVANRTWQVPTLVSLRGKAYLREMAAADDPRSRYFTPPSRWTGDTPFEFPMTEEQWEILQAQYEREKKVVGMMASAGVAFLTGSDTPTPWAFPGFGLHDELELLVEAGLTPLQALRAATLNPARFFGLTDDLGTIAEGKLADVVLLDANPLEDIRNTRRIRAVVVNGRLLDRAAIDRLLADVERARAAPDAMPDQPAGAHLDTQTAAKLADLVLLDANPLEDIRNTRRIRAVVLNGRYLDRQALDGLLADAERAANAPAHQRPAVAMIGTGNLGGMLGPVIAGLGYPLIYGSREPEREAVRALVARSGANASAALPRDAASQAEIIILGVPSDVLEEVARGLGDLTGKIVIDVSGGSKRVAEDGYLELVSDSTNAERIQSRHPTARVVRIMIPSIVYFVDPLLAGTPPTVPIAGHDPRAREAVARMIFDIGLDPWDAGPLRFSRVFDAMGLMSLVPAQQGHTEAYEVRFLPSVPLSCFLDVAELFGFGRPYDLGDVPRFPRRQAPLPCSEWHRRLEGIVQR
jgi:8-hydroxy-5-deazaflavin:NADPH oxidoreductase